MGWAFASKSDVGTSGAAFLKIGPGARPEGMGEAFTGVADDVHSIYWNPSGLGLLKNPELVGMHMQYFQDIRYEFMAFAYPTESLGTWGFAVTNLYTGTLDKRTGDTDAPIGQFDGNDTAYWASYAYPITSRLSVGGNMKYIRQTLDTYSANAYAADGGILYDTDWNGVRLGCVVQNMGSRVKFVDESDPLPLTVRLGGSVPLLRKDLLLSTDLILPRDNQAGVALGGEYKRHLTKELAATFRSGYRTDTTVSGLSGISIGGGIEFGRVNFDFAWQPMGDLGNAYRYAIQIKFGDVGSVNESAPAHPRANLQKADAATYSTEPLFPL